jgi:hypothetical protein
MKVICHRGNLNGPNPDKENQPEYIDIAIKSGFDVEIDVWSSYDSLYLGHDGPQYKIDFRWLRDRLTRVWIHCKNMEAVQSLLDSGYDFNIFWHQTDDMTLTSHKYCWTFPGKKLNERSIAVMPELETDWNFSIACAVCTDFPMSVLDKLPQFKLETAYAKYVEECMYVEDYPVDLTTFKQTFRSVIA